MRFSFKNLLFLSCIFLQSFLILYLLITNSTSTTTINDVIITKETPSKRPCICPSHHQTAPPSTPPILNLKFTNGSLKKKEKIYLLVVIISSVKGIKRRNAIRQTWAKNYQNNNNNNKNNDNNKLSSINLHLNGSRKVLVKFSIGTQGLDKDTLERLYTEQKEHNDLLLLNNLIESYHNLTLKVLLTFVHVYRNFDITYLFKGDDDTFVLLDVIVQELEQRDLKNNLKNNFKSDPKSDPKSDLKSDLNHNSDLKSDLNQNGDHNIDLSHDLSQEDSSPSYYWGFFNGRARVKRKGKWKEKEWFLCSNYLPYALGGGYVLSKDLVYRIAVNSNGLQLYHSEDVSVGVWLSPYKAERRHDVRFNTEFVSRGCRNVYIVSHKQSISDMMSKYDNLLQFGRQCLREHQSRWSYVYNWSVSPLECCQRQEGIP